MSESAIRARIKTVLEGVSGIGVVHDYERYSRSLSKWLELMRSNGTVNGWVIHREATSARADTMPTIHRVHRFRITGVYGLDDASATEKALQGLVESIFDAFTADITLAGTCISIDPLQIEAVDVLEYNGTLYHIADLLLTAYERATYS